MEDQAVCLLPLPQPISTPLVLPPDPVLHCEWTIATTGFDDVSTWILPRSELGKMDTEASEKVPFRLSANHTYLALTSPACACVVCALVDFGASFGDETL